MTGVGMSRMVDLEDVRPGMRIRFDSESPVHWVRAVEVWQSFADGMEPDGYVGIYVDDVHDPIRFERGSHPAELVSP